ncbi:MAG: E2/UBC family protein [Flavisolibacter sp.]
MRRQFQLPEKDTSFLDAQGLEWETVLSSGMQWLLVHQFPVPTGYNTTTVTVAVKIETGYPRAQLDMAYFYPALQRQDGQVIGAISVQPIDGMNYQRWSRHRTAQNPWREGVDDISTHLSMVKYWFIEEFLKRPNALRA